MLLLAYIAQQSLNIYVIYADYRFHWTARTVGLSLAVVGIIAGIYGVLLVKQVVAKAGERGSILIGLAGGAAGFLMFGMSKTGLLLFLGIPVFNLINLVWPSAQSLMTHEIPPSEQGQLQGAVNSLRGIAGLIGPGLFAYAFSRVIGPSAVIDLPGIPFFVASTLLLASMVFAERATRPARNP